MTLIQKIKVRLWRIIVVKFRETNYYPKTYKAYWHYRFTKTNKEAHHSNYYAAIPNRGAGIGHQMANWIAGYWYAEQFDLNFAHIPFSTTKWEDFLGFGDNEITVEALVKNKGYKKVRLPLFNENKKEEVSLIKQIIASYQDKKVIFIAEQDQYYKNQFGVMHAIKAKFHQAPARNKMNLLYDKDHFNIAIHVRRGDIVIGQETKNPNLLMRFQNNSYFENVLETVVNNIKTSKPIHIYLFSQGKRIDFKEFEQFKNMNYCLEMSAQDSFEHMVYADVIITSKSSFSYKPALLSNGIKVCPSNFWHGYPKTEDWILVNDEGELKSKILL